MPQAFPRFANAVAKTTLAGGVLAAGGLAWTWGAYIRSPYATGAGVARDQPVPFSHQHHAGRLGLDCRFCHTGVESGAVAGVPPVETCMVCHSQVWTSAPVLEPVRASFASRRPLRWNRTHRLPAFVYFDHHVHVRRGIACRECHGAVERMPLTWPERTLHMEWCVACHREQDPEQPPPGSAKARPLENCSVCHR